MKAIIKIGKVEVKFDVPEIVVKGGYINILNQTEFMREAKKLALALYRETKKDKPC